MGRNWNKDDKSKKTKQIAVRVSEEEKASFEQLARDGGYNNLSDWLYRLMKADLARYDRERAPGKKGNQRR